jgi:BASS family bile acid:Na+ symporter
MSTEKTGLSYLRKFMPGLAFGAFAAVPVMLALGLTSWIAPFLISAFTLLALFIGGSRRYSAFAFTVWVAAFVTTSMFYPLAFRTWFDFELRVLIVPLIQIIMFGMGTQLTVGDFKRVASMPKAVIIGIVLQFSVMPFVGKLLAMVFTRDPEAAAGMVLIGSCPGGVASNVMTYLANGNVALSVTMTACSTLVAPVMTPAMTSLLAGTYVEVKFVAMMIAIIKMIIVPIAAGLVVNIVLTRLGEAHASMAALSKFIMKGLPYVSMFSICYIIAIITSLSRDALLMGGFVVAIMAAVILHNFTGYLLGYWGARFLKLNEVDSRTVAIEVGLQNGGMASGLAIEVLKSDLAAIPPAVFGPWMNMSGAMLASYWASKPPRKGGEKLKEDDDVRS